MRRLALIALREYLAYVRTPGFWLSMLLLPVGLSLYALAPTLLARTSPVPRLAVVDLSGRDLASGIGRAVARPGAGGKPTAIVVPLPGAPFADAAAARAAAARALAAPPQAAGAVEAAAILRPAPQGGVALDFWTRTIGDRSLERAVADAVAGAMRARAFAAGGLAPGVVTRIEALAPTVTDFSPRAANGRVALQDRLPAITGFAMGLLLWMVVLTGAGMLLSSVIEEKSSRILEVLLTSASVPEIMGGKIAGVAAVSGTVMGVWLSLAGAVVFARWPDVGADLVTLLFAKGLIVYFALAFVGGYLMFATFYVTVGASCESVREAQTLLGPVMIVMSIPVVFMSQGLSAPDTPLLRILEWVPPFTPFMMAARAGAAPGLAEVAGAVALMGATTALELWFAVPAFKSGALASGRFDWRRLGRAFRRAEG